ncbi:MAG: glycosyltransferase [Pseudomonadales bacterium]|nr:glycosyltransferase [Pseudomonadales bacterium]
MKVLHVVRTYFPDTTGGMQEVIRQTCLNTAPLGVENRVFTPSPKPNPAVIESAEAEIHRVKLNFEIASCSFCWTGLGSFRKQVEWADVVHYHFPWPFADVMHFACKVKKPTLLTYHADIVRQQGLLKIYRPLMERFLASVTHIVCTSPNYLATSKPLSKHRHRTDVIPIGLNPDSYPEVSAEELESVRQRFGEDFFLFVGLLRYYKGLHILLEAAKNADFRIVIAGAGPYERQLKKQAAELGLTNVVFAGFVPDKTKVALFKLSRGVVFPSHLRAEAFGVALLEGAMYSKPLISTETGTGTSHVNLHEETGLVVPPDDPAELRAAMDAVYTDSARAEAFGRNARCRFEGNFTGEIMAKQYVEQYQRLLAG